MSLSTWFNWNNIVSPSGNSEELPDIFPLNFRSEQFVQTDVVSIYTKILTDVIERTHGLPDDIQALLWDNCLKSEISEGLVTMLANAMTDKKDLFLVYEQDVKVLRLATQKEKTLIESDYKKNGESNVGVFISFKNYVRSDMVKLYSGLEFCSVGSLHKTMKLSAAIQIKLKDLRASTSLTDSAAVRLQASSIARGLASGKDVMLDAEDLIETSKPDLTATKEAILFLNQKRSFYLGMPASYISGELTGGIGSTGENDTKAIERGLKNYYFAIVKPAIEGIFGTKLSYKSQDFRQITQGLECLKTFAIVDDDLISREEKRGIIDQLFDFDTEGGSDKDGTEKKGEPKPTLAPPEKKPAEKTV